MVQGIPAHQEDLGKFLVVVGHHGGSRCLLGHCEEVMYVLNGPEGFLP